MTTNQFLNMLCAVLDISQSELARRLDTTPQNFHKKVQRETLGLSDMQRIAEVTGCKFECAFILPNGRKVEY